MATPPDGPNPETVGKPGRGDAGSVGSGARKLPTGHEEGIDLSGQDLRARDLSGVSLRGADLQGSDLRGKDLRRRDLRDAKLQRADLRGARLDDASLQGAHLDGAQTHGARFTGAYLQNAALADCVGLMPAQLAAANLENATLPKDLEKLDGLGAAEEAGKSCRAVFMALLTACLYCLLTLGVTTNANLKLDTRSSALPFLDMNVPMGSFYAIAPWLLLGAFVYFQLYLQRLWDRVASLPAILRNGRRPDEALHPWLLASLVRVCYRHLRDTKLPWAVLQTVAAVLLGWGLVPLVLAAMWWRGLAVGDTLLSTVQGSAALACVAAAYMTGMQGVATLAHWPSHRVPHVVAAALLVFGVHAFCNAQAEHAWNQGHVSEYGADLRGRHFVGSQLDLHDADLPSVNLRSAVAWEADLGAANLMNGNLTYGQFWGANLSGASLMGADLTRAQFDDGKLDGVDLRDAVATAVELNRVKLRDAKAAQADLRVAKLNDATLDDANLWAARLNGAFLIGATGQNVIFDVADLSDASAIGAELAHASFVGSVLERSDFSGANLIGAKLDRSRGDAARLTDALLIGATFEHAVFADSELEGADLSYAAMQDASFERANLRAANLTGARMSGSSLRDADLRTAILDETVLDGCDLSGAKLAEARGLTRPQIEQACSDHPVVLDLADEPNVTINLAPCPSSKKEAKP